MSALAVRWIMAAWLVLVGAVFVVALLPSAGPPGLWGIDKIVHFAVFLGLAAVPAAVLPEIRSVLGTQVFLLVVGLGIEATQAFIPGRVGSLGDFLADGLGIAAGMALGRHVWRRWRRTRWTETAVPGPQGQEK
jgi:VanZ family protein